MSAHLEEILLSYTHTLSLPVFVFIASFVEEVIAPIPSPTVMVLTGTLAQVQEYVLLGLIPLALIGAFGKTIGAVVVYLITDIAEDVVMNKFGKFFGVTHKDVESLGKKLGHGFRDYILLTILRALPFMPSVVISVGSGLLKVPMRLFIITTFLGTIFRDGFYLYAGYAGLALFAKIIARSENAELYVEVSALIIVLGYILHRMYHKNS